MNGCHAKHLHCQSLLLLSSVPALSRPDTTPAKLDFFRILTFISSFGSSCSGAGRLKPAYLRIMKVSRIWPLALAATGYVSASPATTHLHTRSHSCPSSTQASVTEADISRLYFYRQWASAAYCNDDGEPGAKVVCNSSTCGDILAHNASIVGSLR